MPDVSMKERRQLENGELLAKAVKALENSLLTYFRLVFLRAIPKEKFVEYLCDISCKQGSNPPVLQRDWMKEWYNSSRVKDIRRNRLKDLDNGKICDLIKEHFERCRRTLSEEGRKKCLGELDISAYFKSSGYVDYMYDLLAAVYPKVAAMPKYEWQSKNKAAATLRNTKLAHIGADTFADTTTDEWHKDFAVWMEIAACLHDPADTESDDAFKRAQQNYALKGVERYTVCTMEKLAADATTVDVAFTPEQVEKLLENRNLPAVNGSVFFDRDIILRWLGEEADRILQNKQYAELRAQVVELQKQLAAEPARPPQSAERAVQRSLLARRLAKTPRVELLQKPTASGLTPAELDELVRTHRIVLTPALLKSRAGYKFIATQLLPAAERMRVRPRDCMIVEGTGLYHLMQDSLAYSDANRRYRAAAGVPGHEAEAAALAKTVETLKGAQTGYCVVRDYIKPRQVSVPDPLADDDTALLKLLHAHPYERFCVLLCGASGLVKAVDRAQLPFVTVVRVRAAAEDVVGTVFPQMLPPAQPDPDDPLLQTLAEQLAEDVADLPEALDEAETSSVETVPAAMAETPAPAVQPAPAPRQEHPKTAAPRGKAAFAPNLPMRPLDGTRLPCTLPPEKGSVLHTENGESVTLSAPLTECGNELSRGGEGALYLTDRPGQVAKLYNAEHLTVGRRDKLTEMLHHDPHIDRVCWPTHLLYNARNEFVGYLMPQAAPGAMPFSKSVLKVMSVLPEWTRSDLVRAARAAAALMSDLHRNNILMGDVNTGNFMVDPKDSGKVYIVDTDSFQLGGFPCPVGTPEFTHPHTAARLGIRGDLQFGTFLRTEEEDDYVLAILVFKILFLGQNPFVSKTDTSYLQAMAQGKFTYAEAKRGEKNETPDGFGWMIWKNLPKRLTEAFTAAFVDWKGPSAAGWVDTLGAYLYNIEKNDFSNELKPVKYHESDPEHPYFEDVKCEFCGREFNKPRVKLAELRANNKPILCNSCFSSLQVLGHTTADEKLRCKTCGRPYTATVWEVVNVQCGKKEAICPRCRQNETVDIRCERCEKLLHLRAGVVQTLQKNHKPILCTHCREAMQRRG